MEINTPRLTLRPVTMANLDTVHAYASDLENTRYMVFLPNETIEETSQFIRDAEAQWRKPAPSYRELAIFLGETHIGAVSLYREADPAAAELGWILDKHFWGHGYAAEAARGLIDYATAHWGFRRFIAHCDAENRGSWRVMEKLGMRRVGIAGGRKNRCSDEERQELTYELIL